MPEFARLGWLSQDLMRLALTRLGAQWQDYGDRWPPRGFVVVRWLVECESAEPGRKAYRNAQRAHWIGVDGDLVFDSMNVRAWGWLPRARWEREVLPVLVRVEGMPEWSWRVVGGVRV